MCSDTQIIFHGHTAFRTIGEQKDVMSQPLVNTTALRSESGTLTPQHLILQIRSTLEEHPGGPEDFQALCSMANACAMLGHLLPSQLNRVELLESLGTELYGLEMPTASLRRVRETITEELLVLEGQLNSGDL